MTQDYRMLIGRQFAVDGVTYTVCKTLREDKQDFVEAVSGDGDTGELPGQRVRFAMEAVLEALLVEEEIVLYQASFLGAAGAPKIAS